MAMMMVAAANLVMFLGVTLPQLGANSEALIQCGFREKMLEPVGGGPLTKPFETSDRFFSKLSSGAKAQQRVTYAVVRLDRTIAYFLSCLDADSECSFSEDLESKCKRDSGGLTYSCKSSQREKFSALSCGKRGRMVALGPTSSTKILHAICDLEP